MATASSLGLSALVALIVSATISGLVKFFFDDALASRKAARDYALNDVRNSMSSSGCSMGV